MGRPAEPSQKYFHFKWEISNIENIDELLNGGGAFVEGGAFVVGQVDLNYLFDAVTPKFDRDADEEIADAVFAFEKDGAGKDLLFIFQNSFGHLDRA